MRSPRSIVVAAIPLASQLCAILPASAADPVITEVAWMGTTASTGHEWIEIYNPGPDAICDLSTFVLVEGTATRALPAVALGAGELLVLENDALALSLAPPRALDLASNVSLNNGGEVLRLCPAATAADPATCDVANPDGAAWFGGDNDAPKPSMERVDVAASGALASSWRTYPGAGSAVTDQAGGAVHGSPGEASFTAPPVNDDGLGACAPADAGPAPVDDAGPAPVEDAGPFVYDGLAITEIYFNAPGSSQDVGKEWIEVANLSGATIDLDGVVVSRLSGATGSTVAATATISRTGIALAPGERAVIAQRADLGVAACIGSPLVVLDSTAFSLPQSSTSRIRVEGPGFANEVRYVYSSSSPAAPSTFDGRAMALLSDDLDNSLVESFAPSSCEYAAGAFGSPGVRNDACGGGATVPCGPVGADGGIVVGDDAGPGPVVDAGPNEPPTLVVSQPAGEATGGEIRIVYSASDPDRGDVVEVELFYDEDQAGEDGARLARGLPGGTDVEHVWRPDGVPTGTYRVFARATDLRGASAYAYAPGTVQVGSATGRQARVSMVQPDGVNDVDGQGRIAVAWDVSLPSDAVGSVALVYDTDEDGEGGAPIVGGLSAAPDGPRQFLWTPEDVPAGSYTICAVLTWTRGREVGCSAFVNVAPAPACACTAADESRPSRLLLGATLAILCAAFRRRTRVCSPTSTSPTSTDPT